MAARRKTQKKLYAKRKVSKGISARRGALVFVGILLTAALLGACYFVCTAAFSFFFSSNPMFDVKDVVVASDGRLSPATLESYSGVEPGANLFEIKFEELRSNLGEVPQVESLIIQRRLPDTLFIRVKERTPLAQVSWKRRATPYLIDRYGAVMPLTKSGRSLPMIEGVAFEQLRPLDVIEDERILYAIHILRQRDAILVEYEDEMKRHAVGSPEYRSIDSLRSLIVDAVQFERFDLRNPDFITATLSSGQVARFPYHSAREKLVRLARVLETERELGEHRKTFDLVPDGLNVYSF